MVMVIKIGGNAEVSTSRVLQEIAHLHHIGQQMVIVHGGSGLTDMLSTQLGHAPQTITSPGGITSRYTDPETLRIFAMAIAGEINTDIVATLQKLGVNALGLSGVDGRLLEATRKEAVRSITRDGRVQIIRDDFTGRIDRVNGALLRQLLLSGYVPVIAPLALGQKGERLNVDGDRAAAAIAVELQAETLAIVTNVPGLLADRLDISTLVSEIEAYRLDEYMHYAQGRMRKKIMGASEALQGGVSRVCIGNAPLPDLMCGAGTVISQVRQPVDILVTRPGYGDPYAIHYGNRERTFKRRVRQAARNDSPGQRRTALG